MSDTESPDSATAAAVAVERPGDAGPPAPAGEKERRVSDEFGTVRLVTAVALVIAALSAGTVMTDNGWHWGLMLLGWPGSVWMVWSVTARGREDRYRGEAGMSNPLGRTLRDVSTGAAIPGLVLVAAAIGEQAHFGAVAGLDRVAWTMAGAMTGYTLALWGSRAVDGRTESARIATIAGVLVASCAIIPRADTPFGLEDTDGLIALIGFHGWWTGLAALIVAVTLSGAAARHRVPRGPVGGIGWRWGGLLVALWAFSCIAFGMTSGAVILASSFMGVIAMLTPLGAPRAQTRGFAILNGPPGGAMLALIVAQLSIIVALEANASLPVPDRIDADIDSITKGAVLGLLLYGLRDLVLWTMLAHWAPAERRIGWLWLCWMLIIWGVAAPALHSLGAPWPLTTLVAIPWNAIPWDGIVEAPEVSLARDGALALIVAIGLIALIEAARGRNRPFGSRAGFAGGRPGT